MPALPPARAPSPDAAGLLADRRGGAYLYVVEPLIRSARLDAASWWWPAAVSSRRQERLVARSEAYDRELTAASARGDRAAPKPTPGRRQGASRGVRAPEALVKTTAQEAGIEVRSERILAPVDRGGYAEVPVEMTLSGPDPRTDGVSPISSRTAESSSS